MKIKDFVEVLTNKAQFITVRSITEPIYMQGTQMRAYCMRNSELEILMIECDNEDYGLVIYVREEDLSE
jgi:hypothetical protein